MLSTTLTSRYVPYLQQQLTPQRLEHSLGVMQVMQDLSAIYELDEKQAMLAGLLHDTARDCSPVQLLSFAEEARLTFREPCEQHPVYLHATVGAYLVEKTFQITEPSVLAAIATHSYAGAPEDFNSIFAWCLRFADLLSPTRAWPGMHKLKRVVYQGHSESAALLLCRWLIEYFGDEQIPIHSQLHATYATFASRLDVDEAFFDKED
jgi:predicted HD superfamily hydrolase involved in NAD metabolism